MKRDIPQDGLITGPDGKKRCWWHANDPLYLDYHDHEWGRPTKDDRYLFEKICLEGFQSGLSWITILRKRENFRNAFANFEIEKLSRFGKKDTARLLNDAGIVRHRAKIESTINNARRAMELIEKEGSLAAFVWRYEPDHSTRPRKLDFQTARQMTRDDQSIALSKELKCRGWTFFGPTTAYAFMQAVGLVNDHLHGCCCQKSCRDERKVFDRPV